VAPGGELLRCKIVTAEILSIGRNYANGVKLQKRL
jgi:hypothetical protein